jgi:uncharacterized protein (TIGR03118 family)
VTSQASAGTSSNYHAIFLTSDETNLATFVDTNLVNPWGILVGPDGSLIVADNHSGLNTFYRPSGHSLPLAVNVPAPDGGAGAPTDLGLNTSEHAFQISKGHRRDQSVIVYATEDGTLLGWNPEVDRHNAIIAVDNSGAGAIYKSMVIAETRHGLRLFAANFGQGVVDVYDGNWTWVKSFTDTNLSNLGFVPFGIRQIGEHLFVTYAFKASPDDGDETAGPGLGYVDEFTLSGNLVRQFASQGTLDAPWGLALAPRGFGEFSGALLVGNFGDGAINAFNYNTGEFLGQLTNAQGLIIRIDGLWGLAFANESDNPGLYFTAGPDDEDHGLLGVILPDRSTHDRDR